MSPFFLLYLSIGSLPPSSINHDFLYCSYVPNPVLVIIDVQPKELGIPTKAYYAVEEVKEVDHNLFFLHRLIILLIKKVLSY